MAGRERWCRAAVVGPHGDEVACWLLEGPGDPDISTVDAVARLALVATRLGGDLRLTDVSPALAALLELAGLGVGAGRRVKVEGQPELGEEPVGLQEGQEERHPGDLPP